MFRRSSGSVAVAAALMLAGCSADSGPEAGDGNGLATALTDPDRFRVVDLSHSLDEQTPYWPTAPHGFRRQTLHEGETEEGFYFYLGRFATPEHIGTHMDAPAHFDADGAMLGEVPVERLIGPAVVIDVRDEAAENRDYALTRERVEAFEAEHGTIPEGAIVLLRTGWSRYWDDPAAFFGDDPEAKDWSPHFPSYGPDAARLLIERGVAVLGTDTASIDRGRSKNFGVHQLANGVGIPGIEGLANLGELPPTGATVIALPPRIARGSGGPVRVIALVPR